MFSGLTPPLETCLELTLTSRDDEDGDIRLGGTGDHGRYIGFVAWGIEDSVPSGRGLEVCTANFYSFTLCSFLRGGVEGPTQIPTLPASLLSLLLVLFHRSLVHSTAEVEKVTTDGALSGINMANEDDVQVLLDCRRD